MAQSPVETKARRTNIIPPENNKNMMLGGFLLYLARTWADGSSSLITVVVSSIMTSCGTFPEIARWWRKRQRTGRAVRESEAKDGDGVACNAKSTNPRTLLLSVSR